LPHQVDLADDRLVVRPHPAVDAARTAGATTARDGPVVLAGPADVEWRLDEPGAAARLSLVTERSHLDLSVADGRLAARIGDASWDMPIDGPGLRVVVDGPVVEIFAGGGIMAVVVPTPGRPRELVVSGHAGVEVHRLA